MIATETHLIKVKDIDETSKLKDHPMIDEAFEVLDEVETSWKITSIQLDAETDLLIVKCSNKYIQVFKVAA